MSQIDFGNIAQFYSADEMLDPDACYEGENVRQKQTKYALSQIEKYFQKAAIFQPRSRITADTLALNVVLHEFQTAKTH